MLYGVRLLINIFDLFIYRRYLETFVGHRKTSTEFSVVLLLILEVVGSAVNHRNDNQFINLITCVAILMVYIQQYHRTIHAKLTAVAIYFGVIFITEPIGYIIHMSVSNWGNQDEDAAYYFIALIMEVTRLIIVEIFCQLKQKRKINFANLPREVSYVLFSIPLVSVISCILLIEIAGKTTHPEIFVLSLTIVFIIIVCNYLMFSMVQRYMELMEQQYEDELTKYEANYKEEYYRDMEEAIDQMHTIKHDLKNRLASLYDLLSDECDYEMKAKMNEMLFEVTETGVVKYSENPAVNSVLRIKIAEAERHGIKVDVKTFIPRKMNIDIGDYGILYGNLLDNAIEACKKIPIHKRFIHFNTKYLDRKLLITITNSKTEETNSNLQTSKKDKRIHGRGLKSVMKVCNRYGGTFIPKDLGDIFQADLLLSEIECLE